MVRPGLDAKAVQNGTFKWDYDPPFDGLSLYEEKEKTLGGRAVVNLPFVIEFQGPKETGTHGHVIEVGGFIPPMPMEATYMPPPDGHWVVWYVSVTYEEADQRLVEVAKQWLRNKNSS